jgi:hypothetical protein
MKIIRQQRAHDNASNQLVGLLLARANTLFTVQNTSCSRFHFYGLVNWVKIREHKIWWVNFGEYSWVNLDEC